MKKLILALCLIALTAGAAHAAYDVNKKAGDFDVAVSIDRNPPSTGINNMTVTLKDKAGQAVRDAKVAVEYGMPAMPGMAPMNYKTDAANANGTYTAALNVSMPGPWYVNVKIATAGKISSLRFTFDAR